MAPKSTTTPLRVARERAGLTQMALAVRANCSIQTISLAERSGYLTPAAAQKLAPVLRVEPAELRP